MRPFLSSHKKYFVVASLLVLIAPAQLMGQTGTGDERPRSTESSAPRSSRNHAKPQSSSEKRWSRERAARIRQAEEEAAEARAREALADKERREKEQVWQVAIIRNKTENTIVYRIKCGDSWKETTIEPGKGWVHTRRGEAVVVQFESGGKTKQYRVEALRVVGHKPTDSDEEAAGAKANNFRLDENGNIELYSER